ncbi:MFS transporter [Proteiniphilum sp. X52]|uniref:MFS transporter n=1 Tax=Proteiniphilum sp. X52 TaxID=2382159 RepID=UPI002101CBFC|nr:MFS transporter [Proteiniphilum sp. X52]
MKIIWMVILMCALATGLSFLDRQVLSISILKIKRELSINDTGYGIINTSFLVGYAIMFTLGGILIDRFGSRKGLAFSVALWSAATFMHGLADNLYEFALLRFILGVGEGGAFPGVIKAVVEWVPRKNRALANGLAIGGSAFGAVIAPPLTVALMDSVGWRGVFFVVGGAGIIWTLIWLSFPKVKPGNSGTNKESRNNRTDMPPLRNQLLNLLKSKEAGIFILIRFLLDPIIYFYMFWIPKFLNETRGVSLEIIGNLFWIPYLALGVSNIFGGFVSDIVLKKTGDLNFSRKTVMGFAALLTAAAIFVRYADSVGVIILLLSLAFFAHGLWITNYITSIGDIFGKNSSSSVVGLSGTAGALSSLIVNPFMGVIICRFSYNPLWIYAGVMYSVAFIIFTSAIPSIKSIHN